MEHGDTTPGSASNFDVVLRGYDRRQVEDHLNSMEQRLAATAAQASELRGQRDRAAARVTELEAGGAPTTSAAPAAGLEGFGARVESILRVATDEAATLRTEAAKDADAARQAATRDADAARQAATKDAEQTRAAAVEDVENIRRETAEVAERQSLAVATLRSTFEGIIGRLEPLVTRLEAEAAAARTARDQVATEATALHTSTKQQFEALWRSVETVTTQMTTEAESRVELSARHRADVGDELALARQVLASLGPPPGPAQVAPTGSAAPSPTGAARAGNRVSAPAAPKLSKPTGPVADDEAATGPVPVIEADTPSPNAPSTGAPSTDADPARTAPGVRGDAVRDDAVTEEIRVPRFDQTVAIGKGDVPRPAGRG